MLYQIQANVEIVNKGTMKVIDLPTFLLDGDIQGIISADHAGRIAERMVLDLICAGRPDRWRVNVHVAERSDAEPGEPCQACAVPGHNEDNCPAS